MSNEDEENMTVDIDEDDDEEKVDLSHETLFMMGAVSHSYIQYNDHSLNLLQVSSRYNRPVVPASFVQKIAFLSYYICSVPKFHFAFCSPIDFEGGMWMFITRTCLAMLPYYFIELFICVYAPFHHLYIYHMVPLFCGYTIQNLMSSFISLTTNFEFLIRLLAYNVNGLLHRLPWDKCYCENYIDANCCKVDDFTVGDTKYPVQCCTIDHFNKMPKVNMTWNYEYEVYILLNNKSQDFILPAQIVYYQDLKNKYTDTPFYKSEVLFHHLFICACLPLFCGQLYKKTIWRVFNWLFGIICAIYLLTIATIEIAMVIEDLRPIPVAHENKQTVLHFSFETLIGMSTAPPIIHFMYSRSTEEITPSRHSTILSVSNVLFYVLQGFAHKAAKEYAEAKAGIQIQLDPMNTYSLFYICPILSSSFAIGPLVLKIYFCILFIIEYLILIITFQTLTEVILSACNKLNYWICKKLNYWMVAVPLSVTAFLFEVFIPFPIRIHHYVVSTIFVSFTKLIVIVWFYPAARLFEDFEFYYYSERITKLRRYFIHLLPFVLIDMSIAHLVAFCSWTLFYIYMAPIGFGAIYMIFWSVYKKKSCMLTLRPLATWGPKEFLIRHFRKKFHSAEFVESISEKCLSRHMLHRAEPACYKLGVQYGRVKRRSRLYSYGYRNPQPDAI